jgi:RHS repeat-associated protein
VPGTPASLHYGIDQIGSVRRVFASATSAPAYGYHPYGLPLQVTAPIKDFVYGSMFYNADSGLYLTNYRAYEPRAGRWLSRDPLEEGSDAVGNLYPYVGNNPLGWIDTLQAKSAGVTRLSQERALELRRAGPADRPATGRSPDVLDVCLDGEGLASLLAQLHFLKEKKTDHLDLLDEAWGGTHFDSGELTKDALPIRDVRITLR